MTRTILAAVTVFAGASPVGRSMPVAHAAATETTETIAIIRHGEKPPAGLGRLSCQGLNRALALPPVLRKAFGTPAAIFAPNPSDQKPDIGTPYD